MDTLNPQDEMFESLFNDNKILSESLIRCRQYIEKLENRIKELEYENSLRYENNNDQNSMDKNSRLLLQSPLKRMKKHRFLLYNIFKNISSSASINGSEIIA